MSARPVQVDDLSDANRRWNGVWWVKRPADYVAGLYRVHQLVARYLLKARVPLTMWEAGFLQTLAYQSKDLSTAQAYWLERIEREKRGGGA